MPSTQDKRDIVINTKLAASGAEASAITSTLDIVFTSQGATIVNFKDALPTDPRERSRHRIEFTDAVGSTIGEIAVKYVVKTVLASADFIVEQSVARSVIDPKPVGTRAPLPNDPTTAFERSWKQCLDDVGGTQLAKHIGKIDSRFLVDDPGQYAISQTVVSADDHTVVVGYTLTSQAGTTLADGTVSFTITASAAAAYTLGAITVIDDAGN